MTDSCGRTIDYMRVSITDRCNLRCRYCMPEDLAFIPHEEILRYEEIQRICALAAELGVSTVKITGGEPLVRPGCVELIRSLKALPGIRRVTLTTNGVLLSQHLPALAELGLDGVNISLDTLDRGLYRAITGRDELHRVLGAVFQALDAGLKVKLNCVPQQAVGERGLLELAALAVRHPVDVRFIEMMPIGRGRDFTPVTGGALLRMLEGAWPDLMPSIEKRGSGPARYFTSPALKGSFGIIDAVSHSFCAQCNRVRLTSEGYLKLCLCHGDGVDLRGLLRSGGTDGQLRQAMETAILRKPRQHTFGGTTGPGELRAMSQIGG